MTLLRVQKTAQMPLVQFTEKVVKVTMALQIQIQVLAIRRSG